MSWPWLVALGLATVQALDLQVTSVSRSNGNTVEFKVDGQTLNVASARGVNTAVINFDGSLQSFQVFDTHAAGSEALVTFVDGLSAGTIVLMGVRDEAKGNMSTAAKDAIETLGADLIDTLVYRASYALVGVKGGHALAEQTFADGDADSVAMGTWSNMETVNVTVTSTSRSAGNAVSFAVDGHNLVVQTARGMNVVVIGPGGIMESFNNFDTHAAGSEALVAFIEGLPTGTLVGCAARDDARGNLSAAAKDAIKTCGATQIDSLVYRGAYALVGIKNGPALAEQTFPDGEVAVASALYSLEKVSSFTTEAPTTTTPTTTPTTTTEAAPLCSMLTCSAGTVLKRAEMLSVQSSDEAVCCTTAEKDMADVGVRSAGFADGNEVVFFANGVEFYHGPSRGLTVVLVRPDGTRKDSATFDTMKDGSDGLAAYIDAIEDGTMVLVGARDEASINLTSTAKTAIKTLGATQIDSLSFRAGYALVGVKGGTALAEEMKKTNEGYAVAVGEMKIVISVDANKPLCDLTAPKPEVSGYVSQGNLNLDAGCRYNIFEKPHATQCLSGSWIMLTGSSNTLLEFGNLINFLAPEEYEITRDGEMIGASAVADVVIEDGKVVHWATVSNQLPECRQVNKDLAMANRPACKQAIETLLAQAPAYSPTAVRITMFISFFWYRTELALQVVEADTKWSAAKLGVVTQVGAWYNVCSVTKESYCPRQELLDMDRDPAIQVFKDEMEQVFALMDPFCKTGRASALGCYVQTISWTNGVRDNDNFQVMNGYIEELMASRWSAKFRLIDFFKLGGAMPEEVINGHGSQMLNLWSWTVMFNAMCPAEMAARGSYAQWTGNLCSGTEARWENCPNYFPACEDGPRCEKWECMNSVPCTLTATDPPVQGDTTGLCDDPVNITSWLAAGAMEADVVEEPCFNGRGLRKRLWCVQGIEWSLPVGTTLLAVFIGVAQFLWAKTHPAKPKQKEAPKVVTEEKRSIALFKSEAKEPSEKGKSHPGSPACSEGEAAPDFALEINEEVNRSKTEKSTKTHKSDVPNERDASPSRGLSRAASRAASRKEEEFADVLAPQEEFADVLAPQDFRSKSKATLKSEAKSEAENNEPVKPISEANEISKAAPVVAAAAPAPVVAAVVMGPAENVMLETRAESKENQQIKLRAAGNKYPLGLARFMGSTHVVVGHLFAKGVTDPIYFFGWGFTWVPWFFMLSGFVLFSAYLKNPKEETMIQYVLRRSTTIYPLYAFSLIPAFILGKVYGTMQAEWPTLLAQSFLMQAWVPHFTENALQMHCWFLSCMVVYWFFFKPFACLFRYLNLLGTFLLMGFFFFLPWLLILIPVFASEPVDWYKEHDFYATDTFLNIGVIMLKYHPLCYFHVFILGMLLAKLRQLLDCYAASSPHGCFSWRNPFNVGLQFVAPLGYLALFLVFSVQEFNAKAWGYKLSARVSVLLPFQAMILFGLAGLPSLPLPFFSYAFSQFDFLENYSYAVYVFQFLTYAVWPQTGQVSIFFFLVFTYASAFVIARCIQQPIQKWWAAHTRARLVVPFILATALVGFSFLPDPSIDTSLPDVPAQIVLDNRTIDMRLNLLDREGQRQEATLINPSLLIQNGQVHVVARRHRRETVQRNGRYDGPDGSGDAVIIEQLWHSDIVMGSKAIDAEAWKNWPTSGTSPLAGTELTKWGGLRTVQGAEWADLCVIETWIPSNNTLIRLKVTGPEDPKAVDQAGNVVMAFDSKPPHHGDLSICRRNQQGFADAVTQMYLSAGVQIDQPEMPMMGYRLSYGQADVAEKNWIPFVYKGALHFVYTPMPHVIVSAQQDGSSEKVYSSTFRPLQRIVQEAPHVQIRGSAQAVFVNDTSLTPSLAAPHYLALLHLFDAKTGRYAHHAYRFGAEPPFMMLQLSSQLPLTEAAATPGGTAFAFASGLAVQGSTVVITYGAGDRDARALVMTMDRLDDMFKCSSYAES
ncbi:unnamed protein product [Effrenium voratum]|uniref:ILEI/PANDER domain-containing protein n=2 Tax=Effrenium voratum TaxID=2562239 RepID=A0AA36N3F2_9DINO|nr:unnamed protein product [Effrenium voratum]CAJ1457298.1 unnamed protein product [Effrenium voratum]